MCVCVSVCGYVHKSIRFDCGSQKRVSDLLELKLKADVIHLMWVLGTESPGPLSPKLYMPLTCHHSSLLFEVLEREKSLLHNPPGLENGLKMAELEALINDEALANFLPLNVLHLSIGAMNIDHSFITKIVKSQKDREGDCNGTWKFLESLEWRKGNLLLSRASHLSVAMIDMLNTFLFMTLSRLDHCHLLWMRK